MPDKQIRAGEAAKLIGMSASALRHYESWGLIPPVPRTASGYRTYTKAHVAYILALRALSRGFGLGTAGDTLRDIQRGDVSSALWRINESCAALQQEKGVVQRTLAALQNVDSEIDRGKSARSPGGPVTIRNAAKTANVKVTSIRYWETYGLLHPSRESANGYRMFTAEDVRDVLMIKTMRAADYSLPDIRNVMNQIRGGYISDALEIASASLDRVNGKNAEQMRGIRYLHDLLVTQGIADA